MKIIVFIFLLSVDKIFYKLVTDIVMQPANECFCTASVKRARDIIKFIYHLTLLCVVVGGLC